MVASLAIRDPGGRPHVTRSRSHTTPSSTAVPQQVEEIAAATAARSPPRPAHGRSQSFLASAVAKPKAATALPHDPPKHTHTLRLPGTHREHKHHLRHRHTQSEAKHNSKHESTDSLPHLVSRLQKEKVVAEKQQHSNLSRQGTNTSNSTWNSHLNNLVRIASTDPYRNMPAVANDPTHFGAADYRAWDGSGNSTGHSSRQPTARAQTWIELALDRASAKKELDLLAPKPADIEMRQAELQIAQEELRARLADVGRQSGEIGRRLEYTYYSLLEKLGSLVGTIQSFQSLSEQTRQLIENFEEKTGELDGELKGKVGGLRGSLERGEERVAGLEGRCERAGKKARELQTRLENVRTIVENWEEREEKATRTWWMVWGMVLWGTLALCLLVGVVLMYKGALLGGRDPVSAGLGARPVVVDTRPGNHSLAMDIPEEVRIVLQGIEERRRGKSLPLQVSEEVEVGNRRVERARDARLRLLDEL